MKRILAPTDLTCEGRNSVDYAAALASRFGGELILLHVYEAKGSPDYSADVLDDTIVDDNQLGESSSGRIVRQPTGADLGSQVRPLSEIVRGAPGRRQIALTFDGGSSADALPELLAALRGASVKCTFFLTGEWVQRYPDSAKQIVADGHEIGNHTWSHPDLSTLSERDISWEIKRADAAIQAFSGRTSCLIA